MMDVINKYNDVSFQNGKFLSDKSYAYDTIYFLVKFFYEYSENGIINLKKYRIFLEEYISNIFKISNSADIANYINETISVLIFAKAIQKVRQQVYKIIDFEIFEFISARMENAYIFNYTLTYFTVKNSNVLDLYIQYCNSTSIIEKSNILKNINEILYELNPSTKSGADSQWAIQSTKYIINNLNFINNQNKVTRFFNEESNTKRKPEIISINVNNPKTIEKKQNDYLKDFDFEYVENILNDIIVYKGE